MPPKKAAKHVHKHAAKKAAKKHAHEHETHKRIQDTRRAYEHLGRVQILYSLLPSEQSGPAQVLLGFAEGTLRANAVQDAADLLRAAEHYCFALLAPKAHKHEPLSPVLKEGIRLEYKHLRERAAFHSESNVMPQPISEIYGEMVQTAERALRSGAYRTALEMARGAEALSHVDTELPFAALPERKGKHLR